MQRPCSHKSLSNQEQLQAVKEEVKNAEEGDGHLECFPRIMGFIHTRNVCDKEVITFSRRWKEEEARLIIREEKMRETKDQALTIQRRYLKR